MSKFTHYKLFNEKIKQFKMSLNPTMKNMLDLYCEVETHLCNPSGIKITLPFPKHFYFTKYTGQKMGTIFLNLDILR